MDDPASEKYVWIYPDFLFGTIMRSFPRYVGPVIRSTNPDLCRLDASGRVKMEGRNGSNCIYHNAGKMALSTEV